MNTNFDSRAIFSGPNIVKDLVSGTVVFFVTLPLCVGIALASGAPPFAGIIAGVIGGLVIGLISGSQTSISGPAVGLTAIVVAQINQLGSFETFLLALFISGIFQVALGLLKVGNLASFVPSSVIKGLLAAVGLILILKQIPHLLGHDDDYEGEMSFAQPDNENTFSEIADLFTGEIHAGAIVIGLLSLAILIVWDRFKPLRKTILPGAMVVVLLGVLINSIFLKMGEPWAILKTHLVTIPVASGTESFLGFFRLPNFDAWSNPTIYLAAATIAIIATFETLLNLEAVDRIDPLQRRSPANRELFAQGVGNSLAGLIGGIPITSLVVQSSINVHHEARSKLSAVFHGLLLVVGVSFLAVHLNKIPLSALAAILLFTGFKLVSPMASRQIWADGRYQLVPFFATVTAIIFTDLLYGVLIGLGVSFAFILNSNFRRPLVTKVEKHVGGQITVIELANQVSFLNRATIESALYNAPAGSRLLIDARYTDYIDPDILTLMREFGSKAAPVHGVEVSFRGFKAKYGIEDDKKWVHHTTKDMVQLMTPDDVLQLLKEGNERFVAGQRLTRDVVKLLDVAAKGQFPFAVVLSCIDSRAPVESIFDVWLGDIFVIRVAGNVVSPKVLGSIEYSCAVAGAKLILVLGHTKCGAVTAAVDLKSSQKSAVEATGCQNLDSIVDEIKDSVRDEDTKSYISASEEERKEIVETVSQRNVLHSVQSIIDNSSTIHGLVDSGRVAIVGAMYNIGTGKVEFYSDVLSDQQVVSQ